VARALVGSESTLVTVLTAEVKLVEIPKFRSLVVLGYPDIAAAADVVPLVVRHQPLACEGLDDVVISLEREEHLGGAVLDKLPEGSGWLMIQFGGDTEQEAKERAEALIGAVRSEGEHPQPHVAYLEDPAVEDNLWSVRELGLGATAYPPGKHETHEGWEDADVPPDRLGDYLRDFRVLLARHDYHGASLYGHFGHGCVHYPVRAAHQGGHRGVPVVRRRSRRPGGVLRRLAVRRARRRPVPGRAAAQDVRPGPDARPGRAQGPVRPGRQDEPRQGHPAVPAG
jgi:FAD/FMN-containing dehydrogenase